MTPEVLSKMNMNEEMRKRYENKLAMVSVYQKVIVVPTDANYPENSSSQRNLAQKGDLTTPQMLTRAFLWYKKLSASSLESFKQCKLNLRPAISRCQSTHKGKKCEQLGIGMVQVQCPEGMTRFGATKCVLPCPAGFTKKSGLYCNKQKAQRIAKDKNCAKGFERVGENLCVQTCPLGWKDQGKKCLKPHSLKLGAPFLWTKGD